MDDEKRTPGTARTDEEHPTDAESLAGTDRSDATDGGDQAVLSGLAGLEGWHVEGRAARVHYSGATDRYSVEFYEPSECVLYWKVPPEGAGETAVPVGRETVPEPLRERIREDLAAAGVDPAVEGRTL
jgi:hypothetical protein